MGLFRRLLTKENHKVRYLSDSAYWLYLAHMPLVLLGQAFTAQWSLPAFLKIGIITAVVTGLLLLVYHYAIRYTWVGTLLNGPHRRED